MLQNPKIYRQFQAKSVWIDEHGHNLQLEAPDLGEKIIRTWLKKRGLTLQKPRKLVPVWLASF